MRFKVHTESGSVYGFDFDTMRWERVNVRPGHEDIIGADANKGRLINPVPDITIGKRMVFHDEINGPINTTRVLSAELLDLGND